MLGFHFGDCSVSSKLSCRTSWTVGLDVATFSIRRDSFYGPTCAASQFKASSVISHSKQCQQNFMSGLVGGSSLFTCTSSVPSTLANYDQILVRTFSNANCAKTGQSSTEGLKYGHNPAVVSLFLGVCAPVMRHGLHSVTEFLRILTWVSGDGVSSDLLLQSKTFAATDKSCSKTIVQTQNVVFPRSSADGGACKANPLMADNFYSHAQRFTRLSGMNKPTWLDNVSVP